MYIHLQESDSNPLSGPVKNGYFQFIVASPQFNCTTSTRPFVWEFRVTPILQQLDVLGQNRTAWHLLAPTGATFYLFSRRAQCEGLSATLGRLRHAARPERPSLHLYWGLQPASVRRRRPRFGVWPIPAAVRIARAWAPHWSAWATRRGLSSGLAACLGRSSARLQAHTFPEACSPPPNCALGLCLLAAGRPGAADARSLRAGQRQIVTEAGVLAVRTWHHYVCQGCSLWTTSCVVFEFESAS